jgi:hypothetical protein
MASFEFSYRTDDAARQSRNQMPHAEDAENAEIWAQDGRK